MPHKLLLADDSVTIQRVIELTFADEDVQVFAVGDGKKAIASIQSDRPDIVLADVGMPERDGYEVAEFIKGNPQLANIPVLLLTGAFEPIDETRARAVGCDGVLVKPFEPQMVINRVKDLLAGRRPGGLWGAKPAPPAPIREVPRAPAAKDVTAPAAPPASAPSASASLEDYFDRLDAAFASVEAATEARIAPPAPSIAPAAQSRTADRSADTPSQSTSSSGLSIDDLAGWDPDLTGDPQRSASVPPAPTVEAAHIPPPPELEPAISSAPPPSTPPPISVPVAEPAVHVKPETQAPVLSSQSPAPIDQPAAAAQPGPVARPAAAAQPVTAAQPVAVAEPATVAQPVTVAQPLSTAVVPSLAQAFAALLAAEQARPVSPSTVGQATVSEEKVEEIVRRVIARMSEQAVRETVIGVAERLVREEIERIKSRQ